MTTRKSPERSTPLRRILYWDKEKIPRTGEIHVVIYDTIYWGAPIEDRHHINWPKWYFSIDKGAYPIARIRLQDGVVVDWEVVFQGYAPYRGEDLVTYSFPDFFGWSRQQLINWMVKDHVITKKHPQGKYWQMRDLCEIE